MKYLTLITLFGLSTVVQANFCDQAGRAQDQLNRCQSAAAAKNDTLQQQEREKDEIVDDLLRPKRFQKRVEDCKQQRKQAKQAATTNQNALTQVRNSIKARTQVKNQKVATLNQLKRQRKVSYECLFIPVRVPSASFYATGATVEQACHKASQLEPKAFKKLIIGETHIKQTGVIAN